MNDQKRVLVVDDDPWWRDHVRKTVESCGYFVVETDSAESARALLDEGFRDHTFDLLITDNYMEYHDAGLGLLLRNKLERQEIPSILHTSDTFSIKEKLKRELPDVIPVQKFKSAEPFGLVQAIQKLLS